MKPDFFSVTEIAGDCVTREQIERAYHRYRWAVEYVANRDVMEIACGTGPGLGMLAESSRSFIASDYSGAVLSVAHATYGNRIPLIRVDAQSLPLADSSLDVVLLFEAIYYIPDANRLVAECKRVLRPAGMVLVVSANKDLDGFNRSPFTHTYFGVRELGELFARHNFATEFFGVSRIDAMGLRQRLWKPARQLAVAFNLIPKTMAGKRWLKRLVFGKLVPLPAEFPLAAYSYVPPERVASGAPDYRHKVVYCAATKM